MTNWGGSPGYPGPGGYGGSNPGGSNPGGPNPYSAPTNFDPLPPNQWNSPGAPPPPQWGQPQWPSQPPPQPGSSKKWWYIGGGIAAALVVLLVIGIVVIVNVGGGSSDKPGEAVKGYLEALSRGDAEAALSYAVDQPASKKFLTDDILKEQIEKWPITNIRILNEDTVSVINTSRVHVAAEFGDKTSDETINVKKVDGKWKLEHGVNKIEVSNTSSLDDKALKTVELFGEPVADSNAFYVFPGWVDLTSTNKNLAIKDQDKPMLLNSLAYGIGTRLYLQFEVSEQGKSAIQSALKSALDKCARSSLLKPPNCPNGVTEPGLAENTAVWRAPTDLSGIDVGSLGLRELSVTLYGKADFSITVKTTTGETKTGVDHTFVSGTADLSQSPPEIKLGR